MADENPFEDGGENSGGDASNQALLEGMRADIANASDDEATIVEVGAPVREEEEGTEEPRGTRSQRRAERGQSHRRQANDDRDAARAETAKLREEMAEMRGRMEGMSQMRQQPQGAPRESEMDAETVRQRETQTGYRAAMEAHYHNKTTMSADDEKAWLDRNNGHAREFGAIAAREEYAKLNSPAQRQHDQLYAKYPDVVGHDKAFQWATATYQAEQLAGTIPQGHSQKDVDRLMNAARGMFNINGQRSPEPTDQQNSSYGRSGRAGVPAAPKRGQRVRVSPEEERMALEFYKHREGMTKAEKLQAWTNDRYDD